MSNPLIDYAGLPPFHLIKAEHVEVAVDQLIADGKQAIEQAIKKGKADAKTLATLEFEEMRLDKAFGPVGHLNAVVQTDELRQAFNACLPKLSAYGSEVGQNQALYQLYQSLQNSDEYKSFSVAQKKDLDNTLRDFTLSGVALSDDKKARFKEISIRLSELTSQFADNVLDATQAWQKHLTNEADVAGIPASALAVAAEKAQEKELEGWLLTLDYPCYAAVMSHSTNRVLRQEMYTAFSTRASDQGPNAGEFDNSALMNEILLLRDEKAKLLGFANYAEASLFTKMAPDVNTVFQFLHDLGKKAKPQAERELAELQAFAKEQGAEPLEAWDYTFWSQRLQEARYDFNEEALRPWFPLKKVLNGLFTIVGRLYGITFNERTDVEIWHVDAHYFDVLDNKGQIIAGFYLDAYAREGKRGGAWMDDCLVRTRLPDGSLQLPVAYLNCNFAPPAAGKPGLLTHDEVVTLFHEFGHGLHHMLTQQEVAGVSGINGVAWDAVELPSQFMENWCWQKEGIELISGHFETGEPLPADVLERMLNAKNFQSAMAMIRQIEFSLFDFTIHANYQPDLDIQQALNKVRSDVSVIKPPAFNRFQHGFSHIFAGGYAAGYYSYKWAEVLSADAFARFEEEGIFNATIGQSFWLNILAKGGSEDPMALFKAFRGREPSVDALLRHSGIAA